MRRVLIALALLCSLPGVRAASAVCAGDCNGDGTVVVSELIAGVNIALGTADISACRAFDTDGNGVVSVNELVAGVSSALNGCPIEPIFPANYADTFTVVRDCELGLEHNQTEMIRVLANSIGAQPYLDLDNPLPVGTIVVKEEYNGSDCSAANLARWSAMRKEMPGFDPAEGDWHWQRLAAPARTILCASKDDCPTFTCTSSGCHGQPACLARDYMCTAPATPPRGTLQPVLERLPAALLSISGTAPTDVYAVGTDAKDGRGPYVVHYNGSVWKHLDSGVTSGTLWWISVTPIDGDFYMAGDNGVVLKFDPSSGQFTRQTTPDTSQLYGVWGSAADDLWAVGGNTENQQAVVWHYDGMTWSAQDVSNVVPSGEPTTLFKVWGTSATDVYAVGQTGVIIHFDGMHWSLVSGVPAFDLFTVHGNGDGSVLAAVGGAALSGVILVQNGSSFADHAPSGTPQMNGVFVPPNGNAIAVGVGLAVAARDSTGWTLVSQGGDLRDLHGTWIDSSDGIWAVGGDLSNLNNGILSYGGSQSVATGPVQ